MGPTPLETDQATITPKLSRQTSCLWLQLINAVRTYGEITDREVLDIYDHGIYVMTVYYGYSETAASPRRRLRLRTIQPSLGGLLAMSGTTTTSHKTLVLRTQ